MEAESIEGVVRMEGMSIEGDVHTKEASVGGACADEASVEEGVPKSPRATDPVVFTDLVGLGARGRAGSMRNHRRRTMGHVGPPTCPRCTREESGDMCRDGDAVNLGFGAI